MMAIALAMQVGKATEPDELHKQLPATTRPLVELAKFKGMKCVSVSQFRYRNRGTKQLEIGRVFRFTYKADYATEWASWKSEFPKRDGWNMVPDNEKTTYLYQRDLKNPKVTTQALMLHKGKIVPDAKSKGGVKGIGDPQWVWVSFNEILTSKKW